MKRVLPHAVLFALGMAGVLSLWPTLDAAVAMVQKADPTRAPPEALLRPLLLLQPAMLLLLGVVAGAVLANRVGLRSSIVDSVASGAGLRKVSVDPRLAAIGGAAAALLLVAGDLLFAQADPAGFARLAVPANARLQALVTGVFYGGITEEIVTRWGLLALIAWALTKLRMPRHAAIGCAVVAAALVFALGHLPALSLAVEQPSTLVIVRTIGLNVGAGIIFGLAFWRRNLETAMLGHALTHVLLFGARLANVAM